MSRALRLYIDNDLTPLQQAAVRRIHEFTEELKQSGIFVRSAMELEFTTVNKQGMPVHSAINLEDVYKQLTDVNVEHALPHNVQRFGFENMRESRTNPEPMNPAQYELNIADRVDLLSIKKDPAKYNPVNVAAATAYARAHTIPEALRATTALNGPNGEVLANFAARPFTDKHNVKPVMHSADASSLHVNLSLYDKKGHNLFARDKDLFRRSQLALLEIQDDATIAMLPNANSLKRLDTYGANPKGLGIVTTKESEESFNSIVVHHDGKEPGSTNETRIENRLPGADADPFVAMALTLAAAVEAVRNKDGVLKIHKKLKEPAMEKGIPRSTEVLVKQFGASKRMRELLGASFYGAIQKEYGQGAALA